ncbi:ECF transporter S component [uncultured Jatrophihabitans sp.]|uniref:ECF transporter S component n=1 Tax=uncultured Jatrophihabitans sp. TaxID=1610747 RepID=UPI0035CB5BCC
MASSAATTGFTGRPTGDARWRTVDIVVAAAVAVVFGVVFWAWDNLWNTLAGVAVPAKAMFYGVWVMAGVLGALIVRKPGAALFTEFLAGLFSALVAVTWSGASIIVYGLLEGLAAELVFALARYRRWTLPVALLSGLAAGAMAAVLDLWVYRYYPGFSGGWQVGYLAIVALSGLVIAGGLSWLLVRALAVTGVLAPFASGRGQRLV